MNGSFRLGGCGDSDFDEPPNPVIERPGAVTLVFQFLKCLPYACGKAAPSATMASILIQTIVSICRRATRRGKSGAGAAAAMDI
jgi:hypothetical protein